MTNHITVLPASTKAGAATIRSLLKANPEVQVRGIYRDPLKAPEALKAYANFEAVKGDGSDGASLNFEGSDAVFYNQPPTYDGSDLTEFVTNMSNNVKKQLQVAGVKKLVILSALGSQHDSGVGILRINHISDEILKDAVPDVTIIRAGYFMEDFSHNFASAKADPPLVTSQFTPAEFEVPMVSIQDLGEHSATALLAPTGSRTSPHVVRLFGPRLYSSNDIQSAVESITGTKTELVMPAEGAIVDFFEQQFPRHIAEELAEMTVATLKNGKITPDYIYDDDTLVGKVTLADALSMEYQKLGA